MSHQVNLNLKLIIGNQSFAREVTQMINHTHPNLNLILAVRNALNQIEIAFRILQNVVYPSHHARNLKS